MRSTFFRFAFSMARSTPPVSAAKPTVNGRGRRATTEARTSGVSARSIEERPSSRAIFDSAAVTGLKSATAAAMIAMSASTPETAPSISWALSTRTTFTAGCTARSAVVTRVTS
jgi:hypothetical protein